MSWIDAIDTSDRQVRKFGLTFGVIALLATAYILYRGSSFWPWTAGAALVFAATAFCCVSVLRPVFILWMKFAFVLAWFNTRLLLGLFYFLVVTPIGIILRLTGKDLLQRNRDRSASTYWIRRERREFRREDYERLF